MATTYKVMTRASVDHTGADTIYTVPSSTTALIMSLNICNRDSSAKEVDVKLVSDTAQGNPNTNATVFLLKDFEIGAGSSLEVLAGQKIVMQTTDSLTIQAAGNDEIDVALSVMELT
tara:strand:+ start:1987 stop:2337 length:351 start_codon:yes stop_codon:yes gene_type:complete